MSTTSGEFVVRLTSLMKSTAPPPPPAAESESDSSYSDDDSDHSTASSDETASDDAAAAAAAAAAEALNEVVVPDVNDDNNDSQLLEKAEVLFKDDKILEAYSFLRKVKDTSLFSEIHTKIFDMGKETEQGISDLLGGPLTGSGWKQQKAPMGARQSNVYTKFDENNHLFVLLETPMESSLLVPLSSVLNETDLYKTWMAEAGIRETKQLEQVGRVHQIVQVIVDLPWPLWAREFIVHGYAVDDIDDHSFIALPVTSMQEGPCIPELAPKLKRLDFDGIFLFRACPADHELVVKRQRQEGAAAEDLNNEPMVLVSLKAKLYHDFTFIPKFLVNYVTKESIGLAWSLLIRAADDIKAGRLPKHKEAIQAKGDFYRWIEQRTRVMVAKLRNESSRPSSDQKQFVSC